MYTVYIYVLDTLADWEIGHLTAELNSRRFFKKDAPKITVHTVSSTKDTIKTMGGLSITPDLLVKDIVIDKYSVLILPGADTWSNPKHQEVLGIAKEFLEIGCTVAAICGATAALANFGLLDHIKHTSNGVGFLDMVSPNYKGQTYYMDVPTVINNHLISAGSTSSLAWTKEILSQLYVLEPTTLEYWYQYFSTGNAKYFFELMSTLTS